MRRLIFPILLGLGGVAILISLGVWQVQRLAWKEAVLAQIEARITAPPVAVPSDPTEAEDEYLPVSVTGDLLDGEIRVLVSVKDEGAGYRVISPVLTDDGRRLLVDRGYIPLEDETAERPVGPIEVVGNLLWPDEVDNWTPEPDVARGIWFARDLPAMATALGTEPILVVAREVADPSAVTPLPIDTSAIPNDHLNYAITWFLLALVWAAMSGYLVYRTLRRKERV
ncbi:SURF1 family protein [Flavimaricola marinus]|uniref:SURF1-like protein n=1 Tax=Flavimaricola marinus TaxID=1819565 RepID=A0A238LAI5_9RHOB|nr:SURF1 family protein [Flavimaricola marinus]SMY06573.1 SURF1 family protein [Flavimaricola marinus]